MVSAQMKESLGKECMIIESFWRRPGSIQRWQSMTAGWWWEKKEERKWNEWPGQPIWNGREGQVVGLELMSKKEKELSSRVEMYGPASYEIGWLLFGGSKEGCCQRKMEPPSPGGWVGRGCFAGQE